MPRRFILTPAENAPARMTVKEFREFIETIPPEMDDAHLLVTESVDAASPDAWWIHPHGVMARDPLK